MKNNSDPIYNRLKNLDFSNAKPVSEIPALARFQAEAGIKPRDTRSAAAHKAGKQVFIERRAKGDYAVRKGSSGKASGVFSTQAEAIERAKEMNPGAKPLIERVRNTVGGKPGQWRSTTSGKPDQLRNTPAAVAVSSPTNFLNKRNALVE
jgi:hypothetical protein